METASPAVSVDRRGDRCGFAPRFLVRISVAAARTHQHCRAGRRERRERHPVTIGSRPMSGLLWHPPLGMMTMKNILLVAVAAILAGQLLAAKEPSQKATLYVQGMTCGGCAAAVTTALQQITGVIDARVSYEQHQAVVTYDPARITPPAIARAAEEKLPGYKVGTSPVAGASSNSCSGVVAATPSAIKPNQIQADRVTFYEVGLVCPAAPKIGEREDRKSTRLNSSHEWI